MKKTVFVLLVLCAAFLTATQSQADTSLYFSANAWQTAMGAGNWQFVDESQIPTGYFQLPGNTLNLPLGKSVTFGSDLYGLQVDSEWANWSGGNMPKVLYTSGATSVTGTFSAPMYAFGIEVQPTADWHDITLTLSNLVSVTGSVNGNGGATFFGWISTQGIQSMTISSDTDFAMGRAAAPVPIPGAFLLFGPGLAALFAIRKKMKAQA